MHNQHVSIVPLIVTSDADGREADERKRKSSRTKSNGGGGHFVMRLHHSPLQEKVRKFC